MPHGEHLRNGLSQEQCQMAQMRASSEALISELETSLSHYSDKIVSPENSFKELRSTYKQLTDKDEDLETCSQ